jgi:hypothetical protein
MTRGRPPKRASSPSTLTLKLPAHLKNHIIDQAEAYDMSITEYLVSLVVRDAEVG